MTEQETLDTLADLDLQVGQPKNGYRFSLDPLLLCDFAPLDRPAVLDLGSGCGIIPLIVARRSAATRVVAVELQPAMAELAERNATRNGLSDRIEVLTADITGLPGQLTADSFDLVLANPPYRKAGSGRISPTAGRDLARHETTATLLDFLTVAKKMVKPGGSICFVHHAERLAELLAGALSLKLAPRRLQLVHSDATKPAKLFLVELLKGRKEPLAILPPVFVKDSPYWTQQAGLRKGR